MLGPSAAWGQTRVALLMGEGDYFRPPPTVHGDSAATTTATPAAAAAPANPAPTNPAPPTKPPSRGDPTKQ